MADEAPDGRSQVPDTTPTQQELFPNEFSQLMAVERQRLDATNRRTEVVRMMVEASDAADKRQFEFQMAQLNARTTDASNKHGLLKNILYCASGFVIVVLLFLVGMAFFGTQDQQQIAMKILSVFGTGLGGAGIFRLSSEAIRKLTQKQSH